jgi:predicted TIM-barrel fold metal-dependent hydrolase
MRERIETTTTIPWPSERELPELTRTLPEGTVVVSTDSHWLEPESFAEYMPEKFRDRAPRGYHDESGYHFEIDGRSTDSPIIPSLLIEGRAGMWDPEFRLREIDAERIDKELLFPQRMLGVIRSKSRQAGNLLAGEAELRPDQGDWEFVQACFDAYNELLAKFCATHPERYYGVGLLNYWNPDATLDEIQKIKALGLKGVMLPTLPPKIYYNSRKIEGLWDGIEEGGLPLSFHVGETFDARGLGGLPTTTVVALEPYRRLFSLLTFSGILERHPELRVVFTEGGISWVPSALFDSDKVYAGFESEMNPKLAKMPSHYWFQNCFATFMEDPPGLRLLDLMGWDKVMWCSDYPHPESTVGYSQQSIWDIFDATETVEQAQAIVGGTAMKLWRL